MQTKRLTGIMHLEPGDTVVERERHPSVWDDYDEVYIPAYYTYTIDRPVPPLPRGTIVRSDLTATQPRWVKVNDHQWVSLTDGILNLSNEDAMKRLDRNTLTIEHQPKEA